MRLTSQTFTYTLRPAGGEDHIMTSNNPIFPGPFLVRVLGKIEVGLTLIIKFLDGEKKGHSLYTTPIKEIES